MIIECPRCKILFCVSEHSGDYVHNCNSGNEVLDNEDIRVYGNWSDYTGSDSTGVTGNILLKGTENEFWGTRANIIFGEVKQPLTNRGKSKSIYRTRQHQEYISEDYLKK